MKTSSSDPAEADGGARVLFTGEFCSDTKRDGVSSLSGDSLLTMTSIKGKLKKILLIICNNVSSGRWHRCGFDKRKMLLALQVFTVRNLTSIK